MAYHDELKNALIKWLGKDNVVFIKGWDRPQRGFGWRGNGGKPVALVCHHTAGAATDSRDPKHRGNQAGANDGVIRFVQSHYSVPAANFTLDRDGRLHVHSAYAVWHAGKGEFKIWPWKAHRIPRDMGNDYMLGVEVVSKGIKRDFTVAQKNSLGLMANACKDASNWEGFTRRLPNHKTWAPTRKVDTKYTTAALIAWAVRAKRKGPQG